jgi:hypothetical protein
MRTLRTPEERFARLPELDLPPRYADVADGDGGTIRMAWVEDGPDDPAAEPNRAAWAVLARSEPPLLCAFSDGDPITAPMEPVLRRSIPGAVVAGFDRRVR